MTDNHQDDLQMRQAQPTSGSQGATTRTPGRDAVQATGHGEGECSICSYRQIPYHNRAPVFHNHFSSLFLRKLAGAEFSDTDHLCPSCKKEHSSYPEPRLSVVVSDSTLHQYFTPSGYTETLQYNDDDRHIDYLTIAGARISALLNAFQIEYVVNPPPRDLDVVLIAGYADIVDGYARDYIIEKMYNFAELVMNNPASPGGKNTFAVGSLFYPPQVAWLADNGPYPTENYVDNKENIDWIN